MYSVFLENVSEKFGSNGLRIGKKEKQRGFLMGFLKKSQVDFKVNLNDLM